MLLKYKILPFEQAFAFQVTGQDSGLTDALKAVGSFTASNGWVVRVDAEPEVNVSTREIYLRGSDSSKDIKVDRTYNLPNNYQRDLAINQVDQALSELVESYKAWQGLTWATWYCKSCTKPGKNPFANVNQLRGSRLNNGKGMLVVEESVFVI